MLSLRAPGIGVPLEDGREPRGQATIVFTLRDGLITRMQDYLDRRSALASVAAEDAHLAVIPVRSPGRGMTRIRDLADDRSTDGTRWPPGDVIGQGCNRRLHPHGEVVLRSSSSAFLERHQQLAQIAREPLCRTFGQAGEQARLVLHMGRDRAVDDRQALGRETHADTAAVALVGHPLDEPICLEPVDAAGRRAARDHRRVGQRGGRQQVRIAAAAERGQHVEAGRVEAVRLEVHRQLAVEHARRARDAPDDAHRAGVEVWTLARPRREDSVDLVVFHPPKRSNVVRRRAIVVPCRIYLLSSRPEAIAPLVWGTSYWVATELLPPGRPLFAAAGRALPAGIALAVVTRRLPPVGWRLRVAALGVLNIGLFFVLLFYAAEHVPGGIAATSPAVGPVIVLLLGWPVLGLRPTAIGIAAGATGIAGIAALVLTPAASLDLVGLRLPPAPPPRWRPGSCSHAAGADRRCRCSLTSWQLLVGGALVAPLALVTEGVPPVPTARNLLGFAIIGLVGTALAYALWFRGMTALPASSVSFLGLLSPIVATALGWAALGQSLSAAATGRRRARASPPSSRGQRVGGSARVEPPPVGDRPGARPPGSSSSPTARAAVGPCEPALPASAGGDPAAHRPPRGRLHHGSRCADLELASAPFDDSCDGVPRGHGGSCSPVPAERRRDGSAVCVYLEPYGIRVRPVPRALRMVGPGRSDNSAPPASSRCLLVDRSRIIHAGSMQGSPPVRVKQNTLLHGLRLTLGSSQQLLYAKIGDSFHGHLSTDLYMLHYCLKHQS